MPTVELQALTQSFCSSLCHKNMLSREEKKNQGQLAKFQPAQALTSTGYRTIRVVRKCVGICISTPVYLSECIPVPITA